MKYLVSLFYVGLASMSYRIRVFAAACFAAIASSSAYAQGGTSPGSRLDSIAGAEVRANRSIGIVAAAFKSGDQLLLNAFGSTDIESNSPMTVSTMMPIGSATKQFTAVAILKLRDEGKLSVDDDITKWLPELNVAGNRITLRHLLAHTGGIRELSEMPEMRAIRLLYNTSVTRDSIYRVMARVAPVFPAGTMEIYSNSGFWLLGRVIEKASGISYEEYVEKRIFAPLGMSRSMVCDNSKQVLERAVGHGIRNGNSGRVPPISFNAPFAAGAICSSAGDLITWTQALHGGKVLSPKSYADLIAPAKLNDSTVLRYGMGTILGEDRHGLRFIGHSGGGFGFSSEMRWYPEAKLAVVMLTNSEPDAITMTTDEIVATVVPMSRETRQFTGDPSPLIGTYKGLSHGGDMVVVVTQTSQGIAVSVRGQAAQTPEWVEGWTFRMRDVRLTFRAGTTADRAAELRYDTGGDHFVLKREPAGK
jgi:D-alanyl-D-alanine carboxypeptidase